MNNTRAVVLGGGGLLGVGWLTGLADGVRANGHCLLDGSDVFGTSAGSYVGAILSLGRNPIHGLPEPDVVTSLVHGAGEDLLAAMATVDADADLSDALQSFAAMRTGIDEDVFTSLFPVLDGAAWPDGFFSTATCVETGRVVVFDRNSGVQLQRAVAASCSVPLTFPPVSIKGRRYFDGGLVSHVNATQAVGDYDSVVVVSCFPVESHVELLRPELVSAAALARAELATLREGRRTVSLIEPSLSMVELCDGGRLMMEPGLLADTYRIGVAQGRAHVT